MTYSANLGGVTLPPDLAQNSFYGFRLDAATSRLSVEMIAQGNGVVRLPNDGVIDPNDYKHWIWTKNTLQFQINPNNGHLELKIL